MSKITGLIREVVILGDAKEILVQIDSDLSNSLINQKQILVNSHSATIRDVNKNTFKTDLTPEMLRSDDLDSLIYGSEVTIDLEQ
tara:strand:- start:541 stop:795 length:255 start_codon:yes stop_codon:yes gene_type:complete